MSATKKGKTLFSYFQKSPKQSSSSNSSPSASSRSVLTPSKEEGSILNRNTGSNTKKTKETNAKNANSASDKRVYSIYDIVWAKVEGYPWWPGLICQSPAKVDKGLHILKDKSGSKYHIQFFDEPPTRAWIRPKSIRIFTNPKDSEIPVQKDAKWKISVEKANEAYLKSVNDRKTLVAVFDQDDSADEVNDGSDNETIETPRKRSNDSKETEVSKRRRIITDISADEDSDEYVPDKKELKKAESESESDAALLSDEDIDSPVKKQQRPKSVKGVKSLSNLDALKQKISEATPVRSSTLSKLKTFSATVDQNGDSEEKGLDANEERNWVHLTPKFDFLTERKRKDANGRPMNHPDYNPRTLYIPDSFMKTVTPGHKQWWEIKSKNFDVVLFFKVGKFYELYHMDAVIGVNELGLSYMKGDYAHSGFPEKSYGHFSELLLQKGYKVGRVEQTETPQMMEERCKTIRKPGREDRVVLRELCRITSKGTRTFSFLEGQSTDDNNHFLLALTEKNDSSTGENFYGACFVDTSIGTFHLGQFSDDRNCSRLRTLIAHYPPTQVLYEKSMLSSKTLNILENCLSHAIKEGLKSGSEFLEATETLKFLEKGKYFVNESTNEAEWPSKLLHFIDPNDPLRESAKEKYELAVKCLGACVWYLSYSRIEDEILTMRKFEEYIPPDENYVETEKKLQFPERMVLDGATLLNLEIIEAEDGTQKGTLLDTMDYCSTPFGKRLFRQMICAPLCSLNQIKLRQDAIENLRSHQNVIDEVIPLLKQLPDLERLISNTYKATLHRDLALRVLTTDVVTEYMQNILSFEIGSCLSCRVKTNFLRRILHPWVHTQGSARRSKSHPDSRAIFYEENIYSRKKIGDFLSTLDGFKTCLEIINILQNYNEKLTSPLLKKCFEFVENGGRFPRIKSSLKFFENAFDHDKAKKDGKIIPSSGVDKEFDSAISDIKKINRQLEQYLETQRDHFKCRVTYFGTGKNRFQLEVPDHCVSKATKNHDLQSHRKGFKRYWTNEIKEFLQELMAAEEHRETALRDIMRRIFAAFDDEINQWEAVIGCISLLDVLIGLAQYSLNTGVEMCKPEIEAPNENDTPFLIICEGRHPALLKLFHDTDLVPNDIEIGANSDDEARKSNLVLVTGPNMGGKSTLMREAGLIVIMAQMGSFVPATSCYFTLVDRIFTRLGANDQITEGESTFFVELSETNSILHHATKNSLILMDELGRGTATFDGSAIAYSVVRELSEKIGCRSLFSTHYHSLVEEFNHNPKVQQGHMSCMVENDTEDADQETITFLYKFAEGSCPKSYGFNAAKLAGVPDDVIRTGRVKAKEFEESLNRIKLFKSLFEHGANVRSILSSSDKGFQ